MITRAARGRTDRAENASEDSCAIPATLPWATSSADMRWLAPTWTALPSGSWPPPSLQPGKAPAERLPQPASIRTTEKTAQSGPEHPGRPADHRAPADHLGTAAARLRDLEGARLHLLAGPRHALLAGSYAGWNGPGDRRPGRDRVWS